MMTNLMTYLTLLLLVIPTIISLKLGCYSNASLIPLSPSTTLYNNLTRQSCICSMLNQNYSSFQYNNGTQTCYIFDNDWSQSDLLANSNSQVCFLNGTSPMYTPSTSIHQISTALPTSTSVHVSTALPTSTSVHRVWTAQPTSTSVHRISTGLPTSTTSVRQISKAQSTSTSVHRISTARLPFPPIRMSPSVSGDNTYYTEEFINFNNSAPLTSLSIIITVPKTLGVKDIRSYVTCEGGTVNDTINNTTGTVFYMFNLINGKTIIPGQWRVAAQFGLNGQVRSTSNDTYKIQIGGYSTIVGHF